MSEPTALPGVTVVVPTRDRDDYVSNLLIDLINQTHRPLEILVVNQSDSECPRMTSIADQHPDTIRLFNADFRNVGIARNWGLQHARYEAVLFIDDDMRCGKSWARSHLQALLLNGVGMVAGGVDEFRRSSHAEPERVGRYSRWTAQAWRGFESELDQDIDHVPGANCSVWKQIALDAGAYDELLSLPPALYEETELPIRVQEYGYRIRFSGESRTVHLAAENGGNRELDMAKYVKCLMRNRSMMIQRYSKWYQYPTALGWSVKLMLAYAFVHRNHAVIVEGAKGMVGGWIQARKPRQFTVFS